MIEPREIMGLVLLGIGIAVFALWLIALWKATK